MTSRPKYNQYLTSNRRQVPAGSGRPASHILESVRPSTGVWSSKEINNGKGVSHENE